MGSLLLAANEVSYEYGARCLFSSVSFQIYTESKIGLIGKNGVGKTSLLRLVVGEEQPYSGEIQRASSLKIGYLPQSTWVNGDKTVYQMMEDTFQDVWELNRELERLSAQIKEIGNHPRRESLLKRYGEVEQTYLSQNPYQIHSEIKVVLSGLGFKEEDYQCPLRALSGGWQSRAILARILLQRPTLLVLDEPTNHLDIQAIEWLEDYLRNYRGAYLIVSHDRHFLNTTTSETWELEHQKLVRYPCSYSDYLKIKEQRLLEIQRIWERQQDYISRTQEFIRIHIAGQRSAEAKGRQKQLDRFLQEEAIEKPPSTKDFRLQFSSIPRSGDLVLKIHDLCAGYNGKTVVRCMNYHILRGMKIGIIGENGSGKSTLLKTFLQMLPPVRGEVEWGSNVHLGYIGQHHENLSKKKTLLELVLEAQSIRNEQKARDVLGSLLFSGDDVLKTIENLSGGEKTRLMFALLLEKKVNVLLLDEPTNHLDMPSQEKIQQILVEFPGTVLFVTHDRYLLDHVATDILYVSQGEARFFSGNWRNFQTYWNSKNCVLSPTQNTKGSTLPKAVVSQHYEQQKALRNEFQRKKRRLKELEEEITKLEQKQKELEARLNCPLSTSIEEIRVISVEYQQVSKSLEEKMKEWEELLIFVENNS